MQNDDLDNNIDTNKGFSNKDSEDYKKSVDKIAQEEDAWKTDSFVYTPKEIAPPKAFNFTLKGKQTPIDLDFKKTDLDFFKKSQEEKNLVLTPEGLTPAKTNFENEPTSLEEAAKSKAKRDDFYTNQESYTYNENPDRRVITPNPVDLPGNEYCPDDHVFSNDYTTNLRGSNNPWPETKKKKTSWVNQNSNYNVKKSKYKTSYFSGVIRVIAIFAIAVFAIAYANQKSVTDFMKSIWERGESEIPVTVSNQVTEQSIVVEEPVVIKTKIEPFHEYIGRDMKKIHEEVKERKYTPYQVEGFYEYDSFKEDKEQILESLEDYILHLKDVMGFDVTHTPAGLYLTGEVDGVFVTMLFNLLDETYILGEAITIEYREYANTDIDEVIKWGMHPEVLENILSPKNPD